MNERNEGMIPVFLSIEEKQKICLNMSIHLANLRKLIHLSMKATDIMVGFPMNTTYQVENGVKLLTWTQLLALVMLFTANRTTKEYMYLHRVPGYRFLQYLQQINEEFLPDVCISINQSFLMTYDEIIEENKKNKR